MEIGMLWFDDSSRTLSERVRHAADFYAEKYGQDPTLCLVNPSMLEAGEALLEGVRVRGARVVMPHHFLIGVDEEAGGANGSAKQPRPNGKPKPSSPAEGS